MTNQNNRHTAMTGAGKVRWESPLCLFMEHYLRRVVPPWYQTANASQPLPWPSDSSSNCHCSL
jgi:hypothetical protein